MEEEKETSTMIYSVITVEISLEESFFFFFVIRKEEKRASNDIKRFNYPSHRQTIDHKSERERKKKQRFLSANSVHTMTNDLLTKKFT